ncbi:glycosyltransferase [Hanamia caeni]|uniref:Glycosyltransferase n=1 Tax=Hanamia caeni TaxID=2294116 RepID=A0A3M9NNH1_9BACT|nr:glycosyltransferase [Hanamia caeni]RNI38703.1 glycosyltransferase [Hanamia caeni]
MLLISITIILFIPYVWLMLYYRSAWKKIPDFVAAENAYNELPFISIIIAARNEEKNIGKCIQSILDQTYPAEKYEIIVTDDHSTDKTVSIIQSFQKNNIQVLHLADFIFGQKINSYKKKSIDTALQFAKGELIVTTDADCIAPPKWLETIAHFYKQKSPVFVALPVNFTNSSISHSLFKKLFKVFQSLDFMTLQGITGASVFKKVHVMCNGANLAYQKEVFFKVGGFVGVDKLASGDDMLLMQKIQAQYPDEISFLKSKEVIVNTAPAETLKDFMNQRIRWASKAGSYTDKKIISVLLLVYLLNVWLFFLGILSCVYSEVFYLFILSVILKTVSELLFMLPVAQFFDKKKQLWWFLLAQPFHILYTVMAGWLGQFGSYQWKGRKVK